LLFGLAAYGQKIKPATSCESFAKAAGLHSLFEEHLRSSTSFSGNAKLGKSPGTILLMKSENFCQEQKESKAKSVEDEHDQGPFL